MGKKLSVVSDNNELLRAFNRAMRAVAGTEVVTYESAPHSDQTITIFVMESTDFDSWLWGEFRVRSRAPLVVLGFEDKESFVSKHPVFKKHIVNHAYIEIPFRLRQLVSVLEKIRPIYDDDTRRFMVNDFCKAYEYALITHGLKIIANDKELTLKNLKAVEDFYEAKGDKDKIDFLAKTTREMRESNEWLDMAAKAKKRLVGDFQERKDV